MYTYDKPLVDMVLSNNSLLTVKNGQLASICCTGTGGSSSLASDFTDGNYTRSKYILPYKHTVMYVPYFTT